MQKTTIQIEIKVDIPDEIAATPLQTERQAIRCILMADSLFSLLFAVFDSSQNNGFPFDDDVVFGLRTVAELGEALTTEGYRQLDGLTALCAEQNNK